MAWSKVKKGKYPFMWWYHKVVCELGYKFFGSTSDMYYGHLQKCCDLGFNIYGTKIPKPIHASDWENNCPCCGGAKVEVRGRYPGDPNRKICPTCTIEKLETLIGETGKDKSAYV